MVGLTLLRFNVRRSSDFLVIGLSRLYQHLGDPHNDRLSRHIAIDEDRAPRASRRVRSGGYCTVSHCTDSGQTNFVKYLNIQNRLVRSKPEFFVVA